MIYFGICKLFLEFVFIFWWKGVERDEKGVEGGERGVTGWKDVDLCGLICVDLSGNFCSFGSLGLMYWKGNQRCDVKGESDSVWEVHEL